MNVRFFVGAIAIGPSSTVLAQAPTPPDRHGEKKAQCLRDAQRIPESTARAPALRGSCDALIGPDKELCLKRGGTVEAGAKAK